MFSGVILPARSPKSKAINEHDSIYSCGAIFSHINIYAPPSPHPICAWVKITHLHLSNFIDTIQSVYELDHVKEDVDRVLSSDRIFMDLCYSQAVFSKPAHDITYTAHRKKMENGERNVVLDTQRTDIY